MRSATRQRIRLSGGTELSFITAGDASRPAVLLLHGFPSSARTFREVVPVHRLAYSFGWDGSEVVPPGSSLVEIDLIEQPDGTLLRLTHSGLPSAEQCAGHAEGWAHYLGRLIEVAAGRDPGPDPFYGRT